MNSFITIIVLLFYQAVLFIDMFIEFQICIMTVYLNVGNHVHCNWVIILGEVLSLYQVSF